MDTRTQTSKSENLHASCISWRAGSQWKGVLIRGQSGSGKSTTALQLMLLGGRLVADDRCLVWTSGSRLYATTPPTISGLLEVHGLGIVSHNTHLLTRIELVVDATENPPERMQDQSFTEINSVSVRQLSLSLKCPMTPLVIISALESL